VDKEPETDGNGTNHREDVETLPEFLEKFVLFISIVSHFKGKFQNFGVTFLDLACKAVFGLVIFNQFGYFFLKVFNYTLHIGNLLLAPGE
jgi:hypothetical protein